MFIFITVCNKGFHKANRISMLLKLKRTQRNLSSTNREVHCCSTSFSVVTQTLAVPGLLLTPAVPRIWMSVLLGSQPPSPTRFVSGCSVTQESQLPFPLFSKCLHINLKHLLSCIFSSGEWIVLLCSWSCCNETTCARETRTRYK